MPTRLIPLDDPPIGHVSQIHGRPRRRSRHNTNAYNDIDLIPPPRLAPSRIKTLPPSQKAPSPLLSSPSSAQIHHCNVDTDLKFIVAALHEVERPEHPSRHGDWTSKCLKFISHTLNAATHPVHIRSRDYKDEIPQSDRNSNAHHQCHPVSGKANCLKAKRDPAQDYGVEWKPLFGTSPKAPSDETDPDLAAAPVAAEPRLEAVEDADLDRLDHKQVFSPRRSPKWFGESFDQKDDSHKNLKIPVLHVQGISYDHSHAYSPIKDQSRYGDESSVLANFLQPEPWTHDRRYSDEDLTPPRFRNTSHRFAVNV